MTCERCRKRGKPKYFGSDPKCAFEGIFFDTENWNCATMNELRGLAESGEEGTFSHRCGDTSIGVIACEVEPFGESHLVMTWYKNRGRTSEALLVCDDMPAALLRLKEAEKILSQHGLEVK